MREPPASVGGIRVERIEDLADGFGALPPSDVLRIVLEGGARVMVRPSGTEPKLKVYIDAVADEGTVARAPRRGIRRRRRARGGHARAHRLKGDLTG